MVDNDLKKFIQEPATRGFLLHNLINRTEDKLEWKIPIKIIRESLPDMLDFQLDNKDSFSGQTLFIGGKKSDYILPHSYSIIHKHFPASEIHMIEDAGHLVQFDKPKQFIEVVKKFLGSAR